MQAGGPPAEVTLPVPEAHGGVGDHVSLPYLSPSASVDSRGLSNDEERLEPVLPEMGMLEELEEVQEDTARGFKDLQVHTSLPRRRVTWRICWRSMALSQVSSSIPPPSLSV